ncbi:MAG: NAD-dependent epimerase/dehydratase family protein [Leptospiraceae bacterium]|nr:NAD-dependent epimerase/dehydratase family protein [Leptospiraceae bacterium]
MGKKVLITGATGMIGGLILELAIQSDEIESVVSIVRRDSGKVHPKLLEIKIPDFSNPDASASFWNSIDIVYYCQGVYTGSVGREEFQKITVDYPDTLANILIQKNHDLVFCLLSGAGADRTEKSRMMFASDKGRIENKLSQKGFKRFHSFRPAYIYPVEPREEPNLSYSLFRFLYPVIKRLGKNSSIPSTTLAATMFQVGLRGSEKEILENIDILNLSEVILKNSNP